MVRCLSSQLVANRQCKVLQYYFAKQLTPVKVEETKREDKLSIEKGPYIYC